MANRAWIAGGTTANWNTSADWSPLGVPLNGDTVSLGSVSGGNNYTVILDTTQPATGSYSALNVTSSIATLALSLAGKALSVSGLTTLSAGSINISRTSTLSTGTFVVSGGNFSKARDCST